MKSSTEEEHSSAVNQQNYNRSTLARIAFITIPVKISFASAAVELMETTFAHRVTQVLLTWTTLGLHTSVDIELRCVSQSIWMHVVTWLEEWSCTIFAL
jgi:hypothetical protein